MDSRGGTGGGVGLQYRVQRCNRAGKEWCPATALLRIGWVWQGKMGSFLLKVPSPHGLEKMALLYLYCLGAACGWAG